MPPHVTQKPASQHYSVIIVGGGQAGLSLSYYLQQSGIDHLVLEKHTQAHVWRTQRWDSSCLVTPNWQCTLPGYAYVGNDPHGFMTKEEIIKYLDGFVRMVNAPVREHCEVMDVRPRPEGGFHVFTSQGEFTADQVVVASGSFHSPITPRMAERLPKSITQMHSGQYRNPQALPEGNVLIVGSGQSGTQIAEDLRLAGRKVYLAVGNAPRCARIYRGRDVVDWLADMDYYNMPVEEHPLREGVRDNTNHYVTGRAGGHDIDLRAFAREGMELFGELEDVKDGVLHFAPNLASRLDNADEVYNRINRTIDAYIAKQRIDAPSQVAYKPVWQPEHERTEFDIDVASISSVVWCTGFRPDFSWVTVPVFNDHGYPNHHRGVTTHLGLYFLGLPWLHTWGSGRFFGIARDALFLAERILICTLKEQAAK